MCRRLASSGALAGWIAIAPVLAQSQPGAAAKWTPGRTAWGEPDLQGLWTNATITPLERPERFAGRPFLTEEEIAQLEERALRDQFAESVPRAGDPGTYNQIWFDRGTRSSTRRTSLIVDPPDGRIPWRPEARKHYERSSARYGVGPYESWLDMDTGERCLTDGLPMVPTQGYNMNYRILQSPGYVVILHEMFHEFRIIPLDGRPHVGPRIGQWLGDSRGHWEGDTLVVETASFADKTHYWWAQAWRASRPSLRLVERLTRIDEDTIDYQFTMHDPESFEAPWTAVIPMTTNQAERGVTVGEMFEYACHEGNYSVPNMLRGARAAEEEARPK
jgi:hypothetical protein